MGLDYGEMVWIRNWIPEERQFQFLQVEDSFLERLSECLNGGFTDICVWSRHLTNFDPNNDLPYGVHVRGKPVHKLWVCDIGSEEERGVNIECK
ncbi:hypothetical protein VNO77_00348 [Canavalia gladiata]|uniref:Uncharacterized protein n=1 Tax=Canavalia gladiata TaxID=3824 RepID=A0AAN9MP92_CANGL